MHLSPAFAQDVLEELPNDARERAISAAPSDVARQWQRNGLYDRETVGRMMEPVVAAFDPQHTVGQTIEELRELVTRALITYVYVVDDDGRMLGIVTMRDLLFSERGRRLEEVMLRGAFALRAADAGARTRCASCSTGTIRCIRCSTPSSAWSDWCAARPCSRRRRSRSRCRPAAWSASRRRSAWRRTGCTA